TAGRNPDLLARSYVRQRLSEVFAAVGMADQEWMQADRHDPTGLGTIFIEHVELIANHPAEGLRGLTLVEERGNVVQLDGLRHREHRPGLYPHRIRLLVIDPVADVLDAVFGQNVERAVRFAQRRA